MELLIPQHVVRGQMVRLECTFDLDSETLYSVKWYKDGNEFYRYVPKDKPPVLVFPLPGVTVDVSYQLYIFFSLITFIRYRWFYTMLKFATLESNQVLLFGLNNEAIFLFGPKTILVQKNWGDFQN